MYLSLGRSYAAGINSTETFELIRTTYALAHAIESSTLLRVGIRMSSRWLGGFEIQLLDSVGS